MFDHACPIQVLYLFSTKGRNSKICRQDGGDEDVELGICMENLGVKTVNSSDALGRSRFHFSSTNNTDRHGIAEILLKVALNTITLTLGF
jgi:hypothetical protein